MASLRALPRQWQGRPAPPSSVAPPGPSLPTSVTRMRTKILPLTPSTPFSLLSSSSHSGFPRRPGHERADLLRWRSDPYMSFPTPFHVLRVGLLHADRRHGGGGGQRCRRYLLTVAHNGWWVPFQLPAHLRTPSPSIQPRPSRSAQSSAQEPSTHSSSCRSTSSTLTTKLSSSSTFGRQLAISSVLVRT